MRVPLPVDEHLTAIVQSVRERGAAVVIAPPGAGKTTRVPPALLAIGPVVLLQPRRIAARSLARRIAEEQGWTLGEEVGWQVRFEKRFGPRTKLLVATEGILTARLQADPLLSEFAVAVLDEFHERGLHADMALALVRQAMRARDDLRVVVMSATLDAVPVAEFLGGCPIVEIAGRPHPVEIAYAPGVGAAAALREVLREPRGHVLVFLPGAPEIRRVADEIARGPLPGGRATVLPLHGSLDAGDQDRALAPSAERKVILATNLAETSLTVDGVTDVVDSGLHKVLRFDPASGLDRLEVERIARDSAEQRAGRAGRTGPGRALRLWDSRDHLRDHREPEIERIDLAAPVLDVLAWGGDPLRFEWFEAPPRDRLAAAMALLAALGAVADGKITRLGQTLRRFPLHPRLARVLVGASGVPEAAAVCAVLSEAWTSRGDALVATDSDVLVRADAIREAPPSVRAAASELASIAARLLDSDRSTPSGNPASDVVLRRALFAGFPDRVAKRREAGAPGFLLANGRGATLARESGVREAEWIVAVDVTDRGGGLRSEALVRAASRIEREWLEPNRRTVDHALDAESGSVRAVERTWYGALVLAERRVPPEPEESARLLADALLARGLDERSRMLARRIRFAELPWDDEAWVRRGCHGRSALDDVDLPAAVPRETMRAIERLAPELVALPGGRRVRVEYRDDGVAALPVRLQDLFGCVDTPRIGPRGEPALLVLLAPNGRPVQTTRDLRGFWERVYPEVRRELRGRYPKHAWPDDPLTAVAPRSRDRGGDRSHRPK